MKEVFWARSQGNQSSWRRKSKGKLCCGLPGKTTSSLICFCFLMFYFILCWSLSIIWCLLWTSRATGLFWLNMIILHNMLCFGSPWYSRFSSVNNCIFFFWVWIGCLIIILWTPSSFHQSTACSSLMKQGIA